MENMFQFPIKKICVVGLVLFVITATLAGGIRVSPAYVECRLDKGRPSGKFMIANVGNVEERYRVKIIFFQFLRGGGLREIPHTDRSMARWIKYNPKEIKLKPKTKRAVRFVILPRGKLKPGEYWAGMELESLKTTTGTGKDAAGRTLKIEFIPSVLVPIFGTVGKVTYKGSLKSAKVSQGTKTPQVQCLVANEGNGRLLVKGNYKIISESGKEVASGKCGYIYVFPGAERLFTATLKKNIPDGKYTLKVQYTSPQLKKTVLTDERKFTYKFVPKPQSKKNKSTTPDKKPKSGPATTRSGKKEESPSKSTETELKKEAAGQKT